MSSDLAIAMAVLSADGEVPASGIDRAVLLGELSLDGRVRPLQMFGESHLTSGRFSGKPHIGSQRVTRCPTSRDSVSQDHPV